MEEPKTTILLAIYNEGRFLERAVESALGQTVRNISVLVIDDGSTDESPKILSKFVNDSRLEVIRQPNSGQAHALMRGLKVIRTPYFVQLDGDDILTPNAVEILEAEMDNRPASIGMAFANYLLIDADEKPIQHKRGRPVKDRFDMLQYVGAMKPRFYRTEAVRAVGGWPFSDPFGGIYMEDKLLAFRMADRFQFIWVDKTLYHKRNHDRNQSTVAKKEYAVLKKWAVRQTLKDWQSCCRPKFRLLDGWVHTSFECKRNVRASSPKVSIVIPARNRREYLALSLLTLYFQTANPSDFEVIVVDDNSSDGTSEMLAALNPPFVLRHIRLDLRRFCTGAKNAGVAAAKGDIIIFFDSDLLAPPNLVEGHIRYHEEASGECTVTGIARWTKVYTFWHPELGTNALKDLRDLALQSDFVRQRVSDLVPQAPARQLCSAIDIASNGYFEFAKVPTWAGEYQILANNWVRNARSFPTPWLLFNGGNQSILRSTLNRIGGFNERLKRMGDWEIGMRLENSDVTFVVAPELEGHLQVHTRDVDHAKHVRESFISIWNDRPTLDVYLLGAHVFGVISLGQLAKYASITRISQEALSGKQKCVRKRLDAAFERFCQVSSDTAQRSNLSKLYNPSNFAALRSIEEMAHERNSAY